MNPKQKTGFDQQWLIIYNKNITEYVKQYFFNKFTSAGVIKWQTDLALRFRGSENIFYLTYPSLNSGNAK